MNGKQDVDMEQLLPSRAPLIGLRSLLGLRISGVLVRLLEVPRRRAIGTKVLVAHLPRAGFERAGVDRVGHLAVEVGMGGRRLERVCGIVCRLLVRRAEWRGWV